MPDVSGVHIPGASGIFSVSTTRRAKSAKVKTPAYTAAAFRPPAPKKRRKR